MRPAVFIAAHALAGCNALTGAADLEPVDCIRCEDSAFVEDVAVLETAAIDTAVAPETSSDSAADATNDAIRACTTDVDCDDGNACTRDNCAGFVRTCTHRLTDGDGDGEAAKTLGACGLDCNDGDKNVFSKQDNYFATPYAVAPLPSSYDYNCDGIEEPEFVGTGKCALVGATCTLTAGWTTATPPPCGRVGKWLAACAKTSLGCLPNQVDRTQACR